MNYKILKNIKNNND